MTIEQAIQKALDGGWNGHQSWIKNPSAVFLDPLFWRSLGKAMGWCTEEVARYGLIGYVAYWHRFIDHLASGKDANSFFEEL